MTRGFLPEGTGRRDDALRGASDGERVTVDVILKRDIELSWGVYDPARHGTMIWLPKSLVKLTGGEQPRCEAKLSAPRWLLEKKGLI